MEFGELLKLFLLDLQRLFRNRILDGDFTLPQLLLISCIPDEKIDMTTLSQKLGVDNSTLTRLSDILVRRKIVLKSSDEHDQRITLLALTENGENIQNMIENKIDDFGEKVYEKIPIEDREEVKEMLSSFHWTLSKMLLHE